MTPRLITTCLFAALLCGASAAAAQTPEYDDRQMDAGEAAQLQVMREAVAAYHERTAVELAASGKPRDLAFAANLLQLATQAPRDASPGGDAPSQSSPRDPRVARWLQLASARAGSDVLANMLVLQAADGVDAAIRTQAADRWRQVEQDNLAPLLASGSAVDSWLPNADAYARWDFHYYEQLRWTQATLAAHPPRADEAAILGGEDLAPDAAAAVTAASILAAVAMPALTPVYAACHGDALEATPTRAADCHHVGQVAAERSDTSLATSFGLSLLQATGASPAQLAQVQEKRRRQDWRMLEWGRISASQPDQGAAQFARLLRDPAVRSEQDLIDRVLAEAQVPLDPPEGWQPPRR